jgi:selenide,water dikinase
LSPKDLAQVLSALPPVTDSAVLVGTSTADDAAVYKLSDELALIQTVDFFTPIVDSPFAFGEISAANSISDVYAMGGRPVIAMNIVGYPRDNPKAPLSALGDILKGGASKAAEAGVSVVGGHSIDDSEPKYGMAVTGFVHPDKIWRNVGAKPGDSLVLTKALGTGIIATAMRAQKADSDIVATAIASMSLLNKAAAEAAMAFDVHACTDVTGFGLLGHLREVLHNKLDAVLNFSQVPILPGTHELAKAGFVPGGSRRNLASLQDVVTADSKIAAIDQEILCDAQTSGGLLFALSPSEAIELVAKCRAVGLAAAIVGSVSNGFGKIRVRQ